MNIGEANAANVLIKAAIYPGTISDEKLAEAANLVARGAHKRLGAGWQGNGDVDKALSERSAPRCDWCRKPGDLAPLPPSNNEQVCKACRAAIALDEIISAVPG